MLARKRNRQGSSRKEQLDEKARSAATGDETSRFGSSIIDPLQADDEMRRLPKKEISEEMKLCQKSHRKIADLISDFSALIPCGIRRILYFLISKVNTIHQYSIYRVTANYIRKHNKTTFLF